ncbi:hypothetical protein [Mesorhizobium salmacidum]|uniref:Uncharacterized protein n=1 Tax=Mesorhizobium salmacidum TaxID=3015171 RepID=A0ABU8L173_9HYPH
MSILAISLGSAGLYLALLYALHLFFTRQQGPRLAAGAVFRRRMRKHVLKGWIWS